MFAKNISILNKMNRHLDRYFVWRCGEQVCLGRISFVSGTGAETYNLNINNYHHGSITRRSNGSWSWPDGLTSDDRDAIMEIVGDQIEW